LIEARVLFALNPLLEQRRRVMVSRSVFLSVVVLFVAATFAAGAEPARKPAVKGRPAAIKPVLPTGPIQGVPPEAITRALEQPVNMEFIEAPLADVAEYIRECSKIPILLDKKAIDDVGVQADTPVTFMVRGLKLRSALNHMLRQLDLTWMIKDEALVITTPEQADATLEMRVYEVADLVAARDEQLRPYNDFDQLIDAITSTVRPTGWDTVGGPGSIASVEATGITVLVISQTLEVHEGIDKLLADLRKAKHPGGDTCPPVRQRQSKPTGTQCQNFMGGGQGSMGGGFMGGRQTGGGQGSMGGGFMGGPQAPPAQPQSKPAAKPAEKH
jgi:hypothetical protein